MKMHHKVEKQDTDGLPQHNIAKTSVPNIIQQLVHSLVMALLYMMRQPISIMFLDSLVLPAWSHS